MQTVFVVIDKFKAHAIVVVEVVEVEVVEVEVEKVEVVEVELVEVEGVEVEVVEVVVLEVVKVEVEEVEVEEEEVIELEVVAKLETTGECVVRVGTTAGIVEFVNCDECDSVVTNEKQKTPTPKNTKNATKIPITLLLDFKYLNESKYLYRKSRRRTAAKKIDNPPAEYRVISSTCVIVYYAPPKNITHIYSPNKKVYFLYWF